MLSGPRMFLELSKRMCSKAAFAFPFFPYGQVVLGHINQGPGGRFGRKNLGCNDVDGPDALRPDEPRY